MERESEREGEEIGKKGFMKVRAKILFVCYGSIFEKEIKLLLHCRSLLKTSA